MNTELTYSTPEDEGVSSEYIINFLNEMEKREAEIHGIMILKNNKVIFEAYNEPYRKEIPHIVHSFYKMFYKYSGRNRLYKRTYKAGG